MNFWFELKPQSKIVGAGNIVLKLAEQGAENYMVDQFEMRRKNAVRGNAAGRAGHAAPGSLNRRRNSNRENPGNLPTACYTESNLTTRRK